MRESDDSIDPDVGAASDAFRSATLLGKFDRLREQILFDQTSFVVVSPQSRKAASMTKPSEECERGGNGTADLNSVPPELRFWCPPRDTLRRSTVCRERWSPTPESELFASSGLWRN